MITDCFILFLFSFWFLSGLGSFDVSKNNTYTYSVVCIHDGSWESITNLYMCEPRQSGRLEQFSFPPDMGDVTRVRKEIDVIQRIAR